MITQYVLQLFFDTIRWFMELLPDTSFLPSEIDASVDYFVPIWNKGNIIFPIDTTFSVIAVIISIETALFIFSIFAFLYNKIRGSG